jgi:hypothetical protein
MAAEDGPFQVEDILLEHARRMGRGSRMEPLLYDTLTKKIQIPGVGTGRPAATPFLR